MLTKDQKKEVVKNLREKLKKSKLTVFCNFERIPVLRQRELKEKFREIGGEIFVVKRRLLQRALLEEKIDFPEIFGPVIIGISQDEILPAKILNIFPRGKEKIDFIGGAMREKGKYTVFKKEDLEELAKLPSKEELLARLIGILRAPILNFYSALNGNLQKLSYILANIREQ